MALESIEKLRELACDINGNEIVDHMQLYPSCVFDVTWLDSWHCEFDRELEALEREIAERYMELPVDADGVPIHLGDELDNINKSERYKVTSIGDNGYIRIYSDTGWIHSSQCRHVKPDPVKELLEKLVRDVRGSYYLTAEQDRWVDECAERIREAVEK